MQREKEIEAGYSQIKAHVVQSKTLQRDNFFLIFITNVMKYVTIARVLYNNQKISSFFLILISKYKFNRTSYALSALSLALFFEWHTIIIHHDINRIYNMTICKDEILLLFV